MIEIDGVKYQEEDLTRDGVVRAERIGYLKNKLVQLIIEQQETENNIAVHAKIIKEQQEGLNHNEPPLESEADG
tara:strand:- start:9786 stop:10007 length:222 start_codon:yes stop_codon:yes gene_type:complete